MKKLKEFYQSKRGKSICFFGFYLIFFLVLSFFLQNKSEVKTYDQKVITNTYSINKIASNNYNIYINDNFFIRDFLSNEDNYFVDIYNVNKLIKKSKFLHRENNILNYELENSVLNELLNSEIKDNVNKIDVYVNNDNEVEKIILDLSNYFEKEKYEIILELRGEYE